MPSTHSAAIAFYASYITFACWGLPVHHSLIGVPYIRLAPLITTPWALIILASRVWLGHHTWAQVAGGAAYGFGWSILWFCLWQDNLSEYSQVFEDILDSFIDRFR